MAVLHSDGRFGDIEEAATLEQAKEKMGRGGWDLALIDLGLGPDDGMDLVGVSGARVHVVVSAEADRRCEAQSRGADAFILKSTPAREFVEALAAACSHGE